MGQWRSLSVSWPIVYHERQNGCRDSASTTQVNEAAYEANSRMLRGQSRRLTFQLPRWCEGASLPSICGPCWEIRWRGKTFCAQRQQVSLSNSQASGKRQERLWSSITGETTETPEKRLPHRHTSQNPNGAHAMTSRRRGRNGRR